MRRSSVGTGPFKFVSFENGVSVTLEANEEFFGGAPEIDRLIFSIVPDQNTLHEAFVNGEIDYVTSVPNVNAHDFDGNPDYNVYEYLSINRTYVTINFKNDKVNVEVHDMSPFILIQHLSSNEGL